MLNENEVRSKWCIFIRNFKINGQFGFGDFPNGARKTPVENQCVVLSLRVALVIAILDVILFANQSH